MRRVVGKQLPLQTTGEEILIGNLQPDVQIYAASVSTARRLLSTEDDFVRQQSRFDRQARLNLSFDVVEVTLEIYLDYVSSQVMAWTDKEINALREIVSSLKERFKHFNLGLPEKIYLVKTSGQEEGYAAYTRAKNIICLPANMVASLSMSTSFDDPLHPANDQLYLEDILNHECFHLFSKNNPERRFDLYKAINYQATGNNVELPNVPSGHKAGDWTLPQLKISNPDAPDLNIYIEMDVPSIPGDTGSKIVSRPLVPVLIATGPYDGGLFFQYLQWQFLAIERDKHGKWVAMMSGGKPLLYDSDPLLQQYEKLVGKNISGEIFHPDEILAQNFVLASKEPTPELLALIQKQMSNLT